MSLFKRKMFVIKNNTIGSFEKMTNQYKVLENEMTNLQREKDFKVNKIEKAYEARIEQVIRAMNLLQNEMRRAKEYIVPTSVKKRNAKKTNN